MMGSMGSMRPMRPMRLALPKGRNLKVTVEALRAGGFQLAELDSDDRKLLFQAPADGLEIFLLKDWDLPLYVQYGIADWGVVGSDVLEERDGDLLVPVRLKQGGCRLSFIGPEGALPPAGSQVRLATKYPTIARRVLAAKPWGAEVMKLSGSVELGPILNLAEIALDIVQTGQTIRENGLVELEVVREVLPCLVVNRASYQQHRERLTTLIRRMEAAGVVA